MWMARDSWFGTIVSAIQPILISSLGCHCIFTSPNSRKSRPPGFVTLAPSVRSLLHEGNAVPYICSAVLALYGGSAYHLEKRFFQSLGRLWPSPIWVGCLSGFMSTVTRSRLLDTRPEHTSTASPDDMPNTSSSNDAYRKGYCPYFRPSIRQWPLMNCGLLVVRNKAPVALLNR